MGFFQDVKAKYQTFKESNFARVLSITAKWTYRLRSVLLSIPVAVVALALAVRNLQRLPSEVGIYMLTNGEYRWTISRSTAAWVPVGITAVCLAMMLLSKKVLYPWLVSLFSLLLPLVLWFTNIFPN